MEPCQFVPKNRDIISISQRFNESGLLFIMDIYGQLPTFPQNAIDLKIISKMKRYESFD
jgi:hypothetical protein